MSCRRARVKIKIGMVTFLHPCVTGRDLKKSHTLANLHEGKEPHQQKRCYQTYFLNLIYSQVQVQ